MDRTMSRKSGTNTAAALECATGVAPFTDSKPPVQMAKDMIMGDQRVMKGLDDLGGAAGDQFSSLLTAGGK
jgi:hypothetical protein